jgi:hypothetical protein
LAIEAVVGAKHVSFLQGHLARLHAIYQHPNRTLHLDTVLTTLLLAFHHPASRSLRQIDSLSRSDLAATQLPDERVCRSTLSDALAQMDPVHLLPLIAELAKKIPGLHRQDHDIACLLRRVIAADGSVFTVPADVLWAIALTRKNDKPGRQIRLNLQLDVLQFLPVQMSVSGADDGSESAAFARDLLPEVIYVADRNFVDFKFIHAVFDKGSDIVVRLKKDTNFIAIEEKAITDADRDANVISDRIGHVPGSAGSPGFGQRLLREVTVTDSRTGKPLRLLTNLLDVPARTIGLIYRDRWMIELFFKWLKSVARIRHLFSHSQNGITTEFYVAVIGVLLSYLNTGRRPSTYTFACLGYVAMGIMRVETMMQILAEREHERELDRARQARKRAQLKAEKRIG